TACSAFPDLFSKSGLVLEGSTVEAKLIRTLVDFAFENPGIAADAARAATLDLLLKLIGALAPQAFKATPSIPWRVTKALQEINQRLDDPFLSPETIATSQHISR